MKIFLPENLDLDSFTLPDGVHKHGLHFILREVIGKTKTKKLNPYGFCQLHSKILQNNMANYKLHLQFLLVNHILITDKFYIVGKKCIGFALSDLYKKSYYKEVEIEQMPKKSNKESEAVKKQYPEVYKSYERLEFDFEGASKLLEEQKPLIRASQYNHRLMNNCKMRDRDFALLIDAKGRLQSTITRFNKDFKKFITVDGKELVSIDIKNSQPYLLMYFIKSLLKIKLNVSDDYKKYSKLNHNNYSFRLSKYSLKNILNNNDNNSITIDSLVNILPNMLLSADEMLADKGFPADIILYEKIVAAGKIKHFLQEQFAMNNIKIKNDNVKEEQMRIYFSSNRFIGQKSDKWDARPKKLFAQLFPNVYGCMKYYQHKDNSVLPILLQRLEADALLNVICKRVSEMHPNATIIPIHDAIMTEPEYAEAIKNIMESSLKELIGVAPTVNIENCTPVKSCTPIQSQNCTPIEIVHDIQEINCTPIESENCTPLKIVHLQSCTPIENKNCTPITKTKNLMTESKFEEVVKAIQQLNEQGEKINPNKVATLTGFNRATIRKHYEKAKAEFDSAIIKIVDNVEASATIEPSGDIFVEEKQTEKPKKIMNPIVEKFLQKRKEIESNENRIPKPIEQPAVEATIIPDVINHEEIISPTIEPNEIEEQPEKEQPEKEEPFVLTESQYKMYYEAFIFRFQSRNIHEMIHYTKHYPRPICELLWKKIAGDKYNPELAPWADKDETPVPVAKIEEIQIEGETAREIWQKNRVRRLSDKDEQDL